MERPRGYAGHFVFEELLGTGTVAGFSVLGFDQQPVLFLVVRVHAHQVPAAFQALAMQGERRWPFLERRGGRLWLPGSAIPQHDGAAAILTLGDRSFEFSVCKWMVFGVDCQAFICRIEARTFRNRPAQEDAIEFQAEIVMEARGIVLLYEIRKTFTRGGFLRRWFGRLIEIAFSFVLCERHNDLS